MPSFPSEITIADLDFNQLWQNARKQKTWTSKGAADWDRKAESFAARNAGSSYTALFLSRLPLTPDLTVLDMGSGPGTLALPIAGQVRLVTAVDYSAGMLDILNRKAKEDRITNIRTIQGAWEDDWHQISIEKHDLVIASRSLAVDNLAQALQKLNEYAGKFVFIADRIAPTPFDPAAFAAIGRKFDSGPDYIYTVNILYSLGIHPHIDILQLDSDTIFASRDAALQAYIWMIKDLNAVETVALLSYIESRIIHADGEQITIRREHPSRWAVIWWEPQGKKERVLEK